MTMNLNKLTPETYEIKIGTIVRYQHGFYRVTRLTKNTANLAQVFGSKVYHKGINRNEVFEATEAFHKQWSQSESYQCMI